MDPDPALNRQTLIADLGLDPTESVFGSGYTTVVAEILPKGYGQCIPIA
jgi:hypothetical protein